MDNTIADLIVKEEKGTALRILFQLKQVFKLLRPFFEMIILGI